MAVDRLFRKERGTAVRVAEIQVHPLTDSLRCSQWLVLNMLASSLLLMMFHRRSAWGVVQLQIVSKRDRPPRRHDDLFDHRAWAPRARPWDEAGI